MLKISTEGLQGANRRNLRARAAVERGDARELRLAIHQGCDVDARADDGWTMVAQAAHRGFVDCVEILASAGADLNAPTSAGQIPLGLAAGLGQARSVETLLRLGADPEACDPSGKSALALACMVASPWGAQCVKLLIKAGAELDRRDEIEWTPLMRAAIVGADEAARLLTEAGATLHLRNTGGLCALDLAALRGRAPCMRVLLEAGADPLAGSLLERAHEGKSRECLALAEAALIGAQAPRANAAPAGRL